MGAMSSPPTMRSPESNQPRPRTHLSVLAAPLALVLAPALVLGFQDEPTASGGAKFGGVSKGDHAAGFESITDEEVRAHINLLASPQMEGRDTPSAGLDRAEQYVIEQLTSYGFQGAGEDGAFLRPWTYPQALETPVAEDCYLEIESGDLEGKELALRKDFVPFPGANGQAVGELVFLGHGVHAPKQKYDDLKGGRLKGKIAMVLTEEPRHKKKLEGPEISEAANAYTKLVELEDEGIEGVIFVRRPGATNAVDKKNKPLDEGPELDLEEFGFHHTWPLWNDPSNDRNQKAALPAIEITPELASRLLGEDVLDLAAKMDKSGRTVRRDLDGLTVRFGAETEKRTMSADNVVAFLPGSDPDLADEYVVLGAHLDHLGFDSRGRLAAGADDNASGVSAMLEVAQAMAAAGPRRSIMVCAFSGEEDGLLGSRALCKDSPINTAAMVTMLNLDMIGRGKDSEAIVLGVSHNKDLGKVLKEALKLEKTGIKKTVTNKGEELWQRSDHASFHNVGVPVLFFFEALPISDNEDYHTWRDVPAGVNFEKVGNTARLVFNTAWLLAQDDDRPDDSRR